MQRLLTAGLLLVATAARVSAQCVIMPLERHLSDEHVAAVLQARVLSVHSVSTGQVATVEVLRLWKGETSRRQTIYNEQRTDIHEGEVELQEGSTFLIIAHRLSAVQRADVGLQEAEPALGTSNCMAFPFPYAHEIVGDAPGYPAK